MKEQKLRVKELPEDQRPYEKCMKYGPSVLSDAELLAVILRTGSRECSSVDLAQKILCQCKFDQGLTGILHLTDAELRELPGVGRVKSIQIQAVGELSKRIARGNSRKGLNFSRPETIADYYMEMLRHEEEEKVVCMMLDTRSHLLGEEVLSMGTVNQSLISPRELFIKILAYHAVSFVLVHNHPSGDPTPSKNDLRITDLLKKDGDMMGVPILDHIIIGDRCFVSLKELGYL